MRLLLQHMAPHISHQPDHLPRSAVAGTSAGRSWHSRHQRRRGTLRSQVLHGLVRLLRPARVRRWRRVRRQRSARLRRSGHGAKPHGLHATGALRVLSVRSTDPRTTGLLPAWQATSNCPPATSSLLNAPDLDCNRHGPPARTSCRTERHRRGISGSAKPCMSVCRLPAVCGCRARVMLEHTGTHSCFCCAHTWRHTCRGPAQAKRPEVRCSAYVTAVATAAHAT